MFQIFGRASSIRHPLAIALRTFLEPKYGQTAEDRSVGLNLIEDNRVSVDRETSFVSFVGPNAGYSQLKNQFTSYFKKHIRETHAPAFLDVDNQNNFVPLAMLGTAGLHPQTQLARVLNLNGLHSVYRRNALHPSGEFVGLEGPTAPDDPGFVKWLRGKCKGDPKGAGLRRFVKATLDMLNADRKKTPYQPTWATLWEPLKDELTSDGTRWRQLLGLQPSTEPSWLIVLVYKAWEAGTLFRPTQLDAGYCAYHHPSVPQHPQGYGGLLMDLAGTADKLMFEYIHQQIDHDIEHFTDGGNLISLAKMDDPIELPEQRDRHHDLVVKNYGAGSRRWRG